MDINLTAYRWLNYIIVAFLVAFGWSAGVFAWATLIAILGTLV